ncbi:hypothetical protein AB3G45_25675 [Shinella sp. S4-D37]|uniref:hypothetical protein n=1 Tax=Shinella sp. S4-D37 TaxID=3161999 RepID=UPI003466632E
MRRLMGIVLSFVRKSRDFSREKHVRSVVERKIRLAYSGTPSLPGRPEAHLCALFASGKKAFGDTRMPRQTVLRSRRSVEEDFF